MYFHWNINRPAIQSGCGSHPTDVEEFLAISANEKTGALDLAVANY
jgi:hypothetical protein